MARKYTSISIRNILQLNKPTQAHRYSNFIRACDCVIVVYDVDVLKLFNKFFSLLHWLIKRLKKVNKLIIASIISKKIKLTKIIHFLPVCVDKMFNVFIYFHTKSEIAEYR